MAGSECPSKHDPGRDAFNASNDGNFICAIRRFPALMLTLALEMVVAFVIQ